MSEIKFALPKGRLQIGTGELLRRAGIPLKGYEPSSRSYRPLSEKGFFKVFHEKDIPVQVSIGNYDLGICGEEWVMELKAKFDAESIEVLRVYSYGKGGVFLSKSPLGEWRTEDVRIVGEMPNIAENFALSRRLPKFRIFPLWGASEVYPPEDAELAIIRAPSENHVRAMGLEPLLKLHETSAVLIANRRSLSEKDLSPLLRPLLRADVEEEAEEPSSRENPEMEEAIISVALPDGHQEAPCSSFLKERGIEVEGYPGRRRPRFKMGGVRAKVIRPQDMPLQVACGNFDLAITGRDWLMDHLYLFPESPVEEILDLGFGRVRIVAAVHERAEGFEKPLRIVSEYVNIADYYARANHLSPYRVIPSWGATEAFLPEDGDILIDNTETGTTLKIHNLRIKETLFESSACLIANKNSLRDPLKSERIERIIKLMKGGS